MVFVNNNRNRGMNRPMKLSDIPEHVKAMLQNGERYPYRQNAANDWNSVVLPVYSEVYYSYDEDVRFGRVQANPNQESNVWMQELWDAEDRLEEQRRLDAEEERERQREREQLRLNPPNNQNNGFYPVFVSMQMQLPNNQRRVSPQGLQFGNIHN